MVFQQRTSTIEVPYVLQVSVGYDFVMMLVPFLVQPMSYRFLPGSSLPPPNLTESNGSTQVAQRTMTLWMMLVNLEPLHEGPDFSVVS